MRFYTFGPFIADTVKRTLHRDDIVVPLPSRAFDTLMLLMQHRDRVLEKDEILRDVWRGVIVEENTLARCISTIRRALDESPGQHEYIVTIPGRGYRFVAQACERDDELPLVPASVHSPVAAELPPERQESKQNRGTWRLRRLWTGLAATAAVLAVVFGLYAGVGGRRGESNIQSPPTLWQLTFDQGIQGEPTWSPDGRTIAYSSDRSGNMDIWIQAAEGGSPQQITNSPANEWQPDYSPDGRHLVFRTEGDHGGVSIVSAHGGPATKLSSSGLRPKWSPSGALILFERSAPAYGPRELVVVDPDGKNPRLVVPSFLAQFRRFEVAWHPDGHRLSIWGVHRRDGLSFWTVPIEDGMPVKSAVVGDVVAVMSTSALRFADADGMPTRFEWARNGDALYFEGWTHGVRNLWRVGVNPETMAWTRGPERLTTGSELNGQLALRADGRQLAFVTRRERIRLWSFPFNADRGTLTGHGTPITPTTFDALSPDLSPDGTRVIYKADIGGRQELREHVLESGEEAVLVRGDRYSRFLPRWTNDSRRVAYARSDRPDSPNDIVMVDNHGGQEKIIASLNGRLDLAFDVSADGEWMLGGTRGGGGLYSLSLVSIKNEPGTSTVSRLLASDPTSNLWQARLSRDQRWITYSAAKPYVSTIQALATAGGSPIPITDGGFFDDRPRWSPDGRTIYFLSNRGGPLNLWGRPFDPEHGAPIGKPFQVTTLNEPSRMIPQRLAQLGLAVAADRLILPISEVSSNIWILSYPQP